MGLSSGSFLSENRFVTSPTSVGPMIRIDGRMNTTTTAKTINRNQNMVATPRCDEFSCGNSPGPARPGTRRDGPYYDWGRMELQVGGIGTRDWGLGIRAFR